MPESLLRVVAQAPKPAPVHRDILASTRIVAESARVLQALSVPEYMEAWMRPPGADRVEIYPDQRCCDRFTIALFSRGVRLGSIFASHRRLGPNSLTYLWEKDARSGRSMVEINLWNHPGDCALKLRHRGILTRGERRWHLLMWGYSLPRLRALLEGGGRPERVLAEKESYQN